MTSADVDQIVAAFLADGWGDRRANLDFAIGHPLSYPVVADADGVVVGTSLVTLNGAAGWIGTVWVDPAWRRRGLGRALTQATIDAGEAAGARILPARRDRRGPAALRGLGFEVQTWYQMLEAAGLGGAIPDPRIRPFEPADLRRSRHSTGRRRARTAPTSIAPSRTPRPPVSSCGSTARSAGSWSGRRGAVGRRSPRVSMTPRPSSTPGASRRARTRSSGPGCSTRTRPGASACSGPAGPRAGGRRAWSGATRPSGSRRRSGDSSTSPWAEWCIGSMVHPVSAEAPKG